MLKQTIRTNSCSELIVHNLLQSVEMQRGKVGVLPMILGEVTTVGAHFVFNRFILFPDAIERLFELIAPIL